MRVSGRKRKKLCFRGWARWYFLLSVGVLAQAAQATTPSARFSVLGSPVRFQNDTAIVQEARHANEFNILLRVFGSLVGAAFWAERWTSDYATVIPSSQIASEHTRNASKGASVVQLASENTPGDSLRQKESFSSWPYILPTGCASSLRNTFGTQ